MEDCKLTSIMAVMWSVLNSEDEVLCKKQIFGVSRTIEEAVFDIGVSLLSRNLSTLL